ncbi:hypothetical protein OIO90_005917 [Microbotryomycetes sp. JL221]|nr:hypothetical protein OIO90_005917 [Microbotryomycetes sp. JL221]
MRLDALSAPEGEKSSSMSSLQTWFAEEASFAPLARPTCASQLPDGNYVTGYSAVRVNSIVDLISGGSQTNNRDMGSLKAAISVLSIITSGSGVFVVAGSVNGSAAAWSYPAPKLLGQWDVFASPVTHVIRLGMAQGAHGDEAVALLALVSANSPVAIVRLDERAKIEFVLAGTRSPELRRSTDARTAREVVRQPDWITWYDRALETGDILGLPSTIKSPLLHLDLRLVLDRISRSLDWAEAGNATTLEPSDRAEHCHESRKDVLSTIRILLRHLHAWNIDEKVDEIMLSELDVPPPPSRALAIVAGDGTSSAIPILPSTNKLHLSSVATAHYLLQIVCLLRVFLNYPDTERPAAQVIAFYHSLTPNDVIPPAPQVFASYWLDSSAEVGDAARSLFGTCLGTMDVATVLDMLQHASARLPSNLTIPRARSGEARDALLFVGLIATERFNLMPVETLKRIAESIVLYLDDSASPLEQAVATELCSRGFTTWQHYANPTVLVRQLFGLATGRIGTTPQELRNMARLAVVNLAAVNSSLFMTTMLHDIRPLILFPSLPRVADAVVKSLDPTVTDLRETVHQAATVILRELVRTYPSIDFHHKSQRLAVGTHEGTIVVYDLRTATPLYVLDAHREPVTALSWSPDGHRLVSVSLEESKTVVWKVGQGIFSMFMPGAPPRQGTGLKDGGSAPYKTFDFHVGDEACMATAATLEWVAFDWPAERTARLRIRETAINFGV